jgi:hypothetical protein
MAKITQKTALFRLHICMEELSAILAFLQTQPMDATPDQIKTRKRLRSAVERARAQYPGPELEAMSSAARKSAPSVEYPLLDFARL